MSGPPCARRRDIGCALERLGTAAEAAGEADLAAALHGLLGLMDLLEGHHRWQPRQHAPVPEIKPEEYQLFRVHSKVGSPLVGLLLLAA